MLLFYFHDTYTTFWFSELLDGVLFREKKLNFSIPRLVGDATSKIDGIGKRFL
jgi:hypothetical protein